MSRSTALSQHGSFQSRERLLILLAASVENNCKDCTTAHWRVLKSVLRTPDEIVSSARNNKTVPDGKLNRTCHAGE